ncbi:hypothetical protein BN3658_00485 [Coriobacteriaceae bacterium CHKCI002]|nr:hypothetical protein BN3658_00485 [Coriobacteriaceae bacterium CHKCI002]
MDSREGRSRAERRKTPEAACSLRPARFLRARPPRRRRPSPDRAAAPRRPGRPRRDGDRCRALRRQWRPLRSLRPSRPLYARSPPIIRAHPNTTHHPDPKSQDAVIGLRGSCASDRLSRHVRRPSAQSQGPTPSAFFARAAIGATPKPAAFTGAKIGAPLKLAATRGIEEAATCANAKSGGGQSRFSRARPRSRPRRGRSLGGKDSGNLDRPSSPIETRHRTMATSRAPSRTCYGNDSARIF